MSTILCFSVNMGCCVYINEEKNEQMILANGCNITKSETFKGVWILSVPTVCTQYLVGAPFALITASIRRGMDMISLWHCWGGMEAQVSLTVAFSSSTFFSLLFHFPLVNTP